MEDKASGIRRAQSVSGSTVARFVKVTPATVVENHPHDIVITKESPNYMPGKRE